MNNNENQSSFTPKQKRILYITVALLSVIVIASAVITGILHNQDAPGETVNTEPSDNTENTQDSTGATEDTSTIGTEPSDPTDATDPSDVIPNDPNEIEQIHLGIDVSKHQGAINWKKVSQSGVEFAMIRVGYRTTVGGKITEDESAAYNIQEALKNGIAVGVYFFSCAISPEEVVDEANWVLDYIADYNITYPVAYNCEGFNNPNNRHSSLTKTQRTDLALQFLKIMKDNGYRPMFYASVEELENDSQWEASRIDPLYKIWAARYTDTRYPETETSGYSGSHAMWQYSCTGSVSGIYGNVDLNVSYYGYLNSEGTVTPPQTDVEIDWDSLYHFEKTEETVTAKEATNLRDIPSQGEDSTVLYTLKNGETATRIGISSYGWSKLLFQGNIYYAVSSLLTTDLTPPQSPGSEIQTQFTPVNELVTAKEVVNLRTLPSVTNEKSEVVVKVSHGTVFTRTGINTDVGWSRVEYNGQTLYCVSQYIMPAENAENAAPN